MIKNDTDKMLLYEGIIAYRRKHYTDSLKIFSQVINLNPDNELARLCRGSAYLMLEKIEESFSDFNRAIALNPLYARAYHQRGLARERMDDIVNAYRDFDRALELDPDDATHHYHRGLLRLAMSTPDQAQANLSEAIRLASQVYEESPQEWPDLFNLALYHLVTEQAEQAERLYQEASAGPAPAHTIRAAIQDLDDLLELFASHPQAQAMHQLLSQHLDS